MWTKIALLLLTAASVHISLSPPQPQAPSKQLAGPRTFFERIVRHITLLTKSLTWLGVGLDILATVSATRTITTSPAALSFCPHPSSQASPLPTATPFLALGALLALAGATLRIWCFRTLGRHFTFEVSILPAHELITSGPYAFVRHPSYTGIYLTLSGATLALFSASSWPRACASTSPLAAPLAAFWLVKCAYAMKCTVRRGPHEDAELRRRFGSVWERYAQGVPYRMVPYVF